MLSKLKSLADRHLCSFFKKTPLLGLELGRDELRYLQLKKSGGQFHIEKLGVLSLTPENREEQLAAWAEELGLTGSELALALPGQSVFKKQIEVPAYFTEAELMNELGFRLSQHFPGVPVAELALDFVLAEVKEGRQRVLAVATKQKELQSQIQLFTQAGLRVKIVDVDLYALTRAACPLFYAASDPSLPLAGLLDLRWSQASFLVFDQQELVFHHQWPMDQALLMQQIKSIWQLFRTNHSRLKIAYLGLAGDLNGLECFASQIEAELLLPVRVLNPFQGMTHELDEKILSQLSPGFLLCCGLARRAGKHD